MTFLTSDFSIQNVTLLILPYGRQKAPLICKFGKYNPRILFRLPPLGMGCLPSCSSLGKLHSIARCWGVSLPNCGLQSTNPLTFLTKLHLLPIIKMIFSFHLILFQTFNLLAPLTKRIISFLGQTAFKKQVTGSKILESKIKANINEVTGLLVWPRLWLWTKYFDSGFSFVQLGFNFCCLDKTLSSQTQDLVKGFLGVS